MKRRPADVRQMNDAMHWLLRLHDDAMTEQDLKDWLAWYEGDDANKTAFDEMQRFWRLTGGLAAGAGGAERIRQLAQVPNPARSPWQRFRDRHWQRTFWFAAASLVIALLAVKTIQPPAPIVAAVPEPPVREAWLPDGSKMELAPKTDVQVQYTQHERRLEMRGGEAYFTVAPNRSRPFVVDAGGAAVRAVGTAFNVWRAGSRLEVTVVHGVVEVAPGTAKSIRVDAGNALIIPEPGAAPRIVAASAEHALAWRDGRLEYIAEPLSAVIADVNRYSSRAVAIRDREIGDLTFTGTVFTDRIDDWLEALPGAFPLLIVSGGNQQVLIASPPARQHRRD